jgi:hypothetical protein
LDFTQRVIADDNRNDDIPKFTSPLRELSGLSSSFGDQRVRVQSR